MTPEEIAAQQDIEIRKQALMLADKRLPSSATPDDLEKAAEKLVKFIKAGVKVA